jgi:DNA-binding transcriptional LysR family regulator
MHQRRFNLPPLDLIRGFEAAARTLSFTKAAEELAITQSAISRQIRALEEHLGVALFERRARSLALTEAGRSLFRAASDCLERLQETANRLRSDAGTPHLTVTTTGGFASLWLIPRLRSFTALHPDVDVRISATYKTFNLERSLVDVAVRYVREEDVPEGALRLFGEELFPVCSPALQAEGPYPLRNLDDLRHHALLHIDEARGFLDWGTWLEAHGHPDLKPAASIRFDSYEQMIQAAIGGQGVAMGIGRLVSALMEQGRLSRRSQERDRRALYFVIRSQTKGERPHVQGVRRLAGAQAKRRWPPTAEGGAQLPTTKGAVKRRKRASTLSAVILPVRGFSSEGMFSIVMVRSAESDFTAMVCVLRLTPGSAQISARVASGPMPASDRATATLTLAGNPAIASRALPSNTLSGSFSPSRPMPRATRSGAPARPDGGLRVTICTEAILPSAAARTASSPSSAPVGTRMRAPVASARSTRVI